MIYLTRELAAMPTLSTGPLGELKVSEQRRRIWLGPSGPLGVPEITVQELFGREWHRTVVYTCGDD